MQNNYDRLDLLKQALTLRGKDGNWLTDQLGVSILDLHADLQVDPPIPGTIAKISELLDVPEAYFWNGYRIEDGQLVANEE